MTRTILTSGTYDFRPSIVSPATTLRSSDPGANFVPSSTITERTWSGFTASTATGALAVTSAAVPNISIPYVPDMRSRVAALGAQAMISSLP